MSSGEDLGDGSEEDSERLTVGVYCSLSQAREHGLVLNAVGLAHWVVREGDHFVLQVAEGDVAKALDELGEYGAESAHGGVAAGPEAETIRFAPFSLFFAAWIMGGFWLLQNQRGAPWMEAGQGLSAGMPGFHWWRAVTALFLHGDFSHWVGNVCVGLLFTGLLLSRLGAGPAWLSVLVSGMGGNLINAWFYKGEGHISIGASTAVFGALGVLIGIESLRRFLRPHARARWQLILPLGGGLGLLALLGAGGEHGRTDLLAHLWGFLMGGVVGAGWEAVCKGRVLPKGVRFCCGILAVGVVGAAWGLALRFG